MIKWKSLRCQKSLASVSPNEKGDAWSRLGHCYQDIACCDWSMNFLLRYVETHWMKCLAIEVKWERRVFKSWALSIDLSWESL